VIPKNIHWLIRPSFQCRWRGHMNCFLINCISSPLRVKRTLIHIHVENESNSPRWYRNTTTLAQLQPWKIIPFNISYLYFSNIFLTTISMFTFDFVPLQSFCHVNKWEAIIHIIEITSLQVVILLIFGFASLYILIICKNRAHQFLYFFFYTLGPCFNRTVNTMKNIFKGKHIGNQFW
jgi:hypothetical protein